MKKKLMQFVVACQLAAGCFFITSCKKSGGSSGDDAAQGKPFLLSPTGQCGGYGQVADASGNLYVTGYFKGTVTFGNTTLTGTTNDNANVFLVKYNSAGEVVWARKSGGTSGESGSGLALDASGNIYIAGNFRFETSFGNVTLNSAGGTDMFLVKYNNAGEVIWAKKGGGVQHDFGFAVTADASGNAYVTGYFYGSASFGNLSVSAPGNADAYLVKYNASGDPVWARSIAGPSTGTGTGTSVKADASGNVYLTGYFYQTAKFSDAISLTGNSNSSTDIFLAKYNASGEVLWAQKAGGEQGDYSSGIATDASGNVYMTGNYYGTAYFGNLSLPAPDNNNSDMFLAKYNSAGEAVWAKQAKSPSSSGRSIATDASGNVYVTGEFYEKATFGNTVLTTGTEADVFVTKYNASGDVQWAKKAGGTYTDYPEAVSVDAAGYVYVAGQANRKSAVTFETDTLAANGAEDAFFLWKFKP